MTLKLRNPQIALMSQSVLREEEGKRINKEEKVKILTTRKSMKKIWKMIYYLQEKSLKENS